MRRRKLSDKIGRLTGGDQLMVLPPSALASIKPPTSRKHGHAAEPGTGPEGETCGSCTNLYRREFASTYMKCALMKGYWSGGPATDIRLKDAACRRWERRAPAS